MQLSRIYFHQLHLRFISSLELGCSNLMKSTWHQSGIQLPMSTATWDTWQHREIPAPWQQEQQEVSYTQSQYYHAKGLPELRTSSSCISTVPLKRELRPGVVVPAYNPSTWEVVAEESGLQGHPWVLRCLKPAWAL